MTTSSLSALEFKTKGPALNFFKLALAAVTVSLLANCSGSGSASKLNSFNSSSSASSSSSGAPTMEAESADDMSAMGGLVREDASTFEYYGWHINIDYMTNRGNMGAVVRSIARQIDIVENSWLREDIKEIFRAQTLYVYTGLGNPGKYSNVDGIVYMNAKVQDDSQIVLLHELMHLYHDQVLGFGDQMIAGYFRNAKNRGLWPGQYVMSNSHEFFAVTASLALSEYEMNRAPYNLDEFYNTMPGYYNYIVQLMM